MMMYYIINMIFLCITIINITGGEDKGILGLLDGVVQQLQRLVLLRGESYVVIKVNNLNFFRFSKYSLAATPPRGL